MQVKKISTFVAANEDVKDGDIVRIETEGEWTGEDSKYGNKLVVLVSLPSGEKKKLTLNTTTFNTLISEFGGDTIQWIKKDLKVHIVKSNVGGKFKDVIFLTHPNKDLEGNEINA